MNFRPSVIIAEIRQPQVARPGNFVSNLCSRINMHTHVAPRPDPSHHKGQKVKAPNLRVRSFDLLTLGSVHADVLLWIIYY